MTESELRQAILKVLPEVFRREVNGGEPLAATLPDEMLVTALTNHIQGLEERAVVLSEMAAEVDHYRSVLQAAVRNLKPYVGPPGASRLVCVERQELGMMVAALEATLDTVGPTRAT